MKSNHNFVEREDVHLSDEEADELEGLITE